MVGRENERSRETLRQTDASMSELGPEVSRDGECEEPLFLLSAHANVMDDERLALIALPIADDHNVRQVSAYSAGN